MRVLLAMLGARRRYLVPEVMEELGVLGCFVTDVFMGKVGWLRSAIALVARWVRPKSVRALLGRSSSRIARERIVAFQWLGIRYAIATHVGRGDARLFAAVNRRFCLKSLPHLRAIDVCWAYNGAARELFEAARAKGIRCVLEQVIAPRDDELRELRQAREDWPQWDCAEEQARPATSDPLAAREQAEWRLAHMIVVGSRYVRDCLQRSGVPAGRCTIVPSGIDLERFQVGTEVRGGRPLRVLFVGQINLRKGVPYLLEAARRLNTARIELRLIGALQSRRECLAPFAPWAWFSGPIPLAEMASYYQWADIVVVPSICEGSAMVTYEARGCGVPIIATANAGAFFSPGVDGLEIPVRDAEAIASVLDRLARNRNELHGLREGAIANRHALGRDAYRDRIRSVLEAVRGPQFHA